MPSSNSANPYEARRKKINPYNKTQQALQTGYSQAGDNVEPTPLPYHDQNRPGHVEKAQPVRQGLDPSIYNRQTQAPVSIGTQETMLFTSVFPFHLVPRPTSANVIQRQKVNFGTINLNDNTFLDICVLNVTRAEGTTASAAAQPIADLAPPQIPSNSLAGNPEMVNPNFNQDASVPNAPIPGGTGSTIAGTVGTFVPASIGEFYKICSFGHSEVPGVPATGGITYQMWVDGTLLMEWDDFQWSPVTPKIDQWKFDVPIFVERQIVLRVINRTGDAGSATNITTGEIEACFAGWSEQKMGFLETDKVQIQNVQN